MNQSKVYYPGLDALRGIAIILVVLYHYTPFFRIGWIGVDLFFVLSGFLITTNLLATRNEKNYYKRFLFRRSLRIFPVYFLILCFFYLGCYLLFSQKGDGTTYHYYVSNQLWFWTFTQNWLIVYEGPPPSIYLQHFWSLAVEEQFYLVWPFLIYVIRSTDLLRYLFIALFATALLVRIYFWHYPSGHEAYYYNTFARMDSICAGAYLAVLNIKGYKIMKWQRYVSFLAFGALLLYAGMFTKGFSHDSIHFATIGYSVGALFFMCICSNMLYSNTKIANNGVLRYAGRISYGIYVYHIPVYAVCIFVLHKFQFFNTKDGSMVFVPLISLLITLFISFVSYNLLERPLLKLKQFQN